MEEDGEQVAGLVAACHVVGLVFHPHPSIGGEPERVAQRVGPFEGCDDEAGSLHICHLGVELGHHCVAGGLGEPVGRGEAVPCQVATKGEKGVGLPAGPQGGDALHELQHMVPIGVR